MRAGEFSLPDFLNLGIAPPPPRGAMAVAPRAALHPAFTIHDTFSRIPRAFTPLVLQAYLLPFGSAIPGNAYYLPTFSPLLPNPYRAPG